MLPLLDRFEPGAIVICCGADSLAGDPLSTMKLSNVALWDTVGRLLARAVPTVILGGGGYNPWTVSRYWAGLWGYINGESMPARLPPEAEAFMRSMECDLIDEDEVEEAWLTTLADSPCPGPVRDEVVSVAESAFSE